MNLCRVPVQYNQWKFKCRLSRHTLCARINRALHVDGRAQAEFLHAQLLHDRVPLDAKATALAADHVAALDLVCNHLVKQSGHLVDAASTGSALEIGRAHV